MTQANIHSSCPMNKSFKNLPPELRPRERLMRIGSATDFTNEELLAILLRTGFHGCDVWELSHRLLEAFHGLNELITSDPRSMITRIDEFNKANPTRLIKHIGIARILELHAAFELVKRARIEQDQFFHSKKLCSSAAAYTLFHRIVDSKPEQEYFLVLPMDSAYHPLSDPICIHKGLVDNVRVHPREVFHEAIRWRAYALIVAHNHPSGDPTPSKEDIVLTKTLIDVGRLHQIPIIDHLIMGDPSANAGTGFVSIRNLAILDFS